MTKHCRSKGSNIVYWLGEKLYLNITNKCTNNCYFCLRKFKTGIGRFNLKLGGEPSLTDVIKELKNVLNQKPWREIVFCGFGEPLSKLDMLLQVAYWINNHASKPIRVDTNGHAFLLYPERDVAEELKEAGVNKLSISLNAHSKALYNKICRPKFENAFEKVLEFIEHSRDIGLDVEVTAVTVPEVEISKVERVAFDMGVEFRTRPYLSCVW